MMRGGLWEDPEIPVMKHSYPGTSNKTGFIISDEKFINGISGVIKWEYNHYGLFFGQFKQENNPTAFDISMENLIKRGCYFNHANQIIGIVLNVGNQTVASG